MTGFERFAADAYPQLVAALGHQFGDRFLAEDLAQEALVRARQHWSRVSTMEAPVGWAFRVGCNLGTSVMRRRGAEQRAYARRQRHEHDSVHVDPDTPDRLVLHEALQQLPEAQRRAVVAKFYLGLNGPQAAAALGSSANSIRVQTHRGIARLRELLGDDVLEAADA